tara:strand:+ start:114 stop:353 length:240 start_codon:yes stop_codon:yes gene_type:complete
MSTLFVDNVENKTSGSAVVLGNAADQTLNALTIDAGKNGLVVGPVTFTSVTCEGNLQCVGNLSFTTTLTIGANGSLNVI